MFFVYASMGAAFGRAVNGPNSPHSVADWNSISKSLLTQSTAGSLTGASGVYLSGGFGLWELAYPVIGAAIGFRALGSYRWIGVGWLIHAGWDIAHHLWGNPIWPFMPSSPFGCMIFDGVIAPWFLAGAPSFLKRPHAAMRATGA